MLFGQSDGVPAKDKRVLLRQVPKRQSHPVCIAWREDWGRQHKVVRCCLFADEFVKELYWRQASFKGNYPKEIQDMVEKQ